MPYQPELLLPAWLAAAALAVIVAATCAAVLSQVFDDSFGQRLALSIVALAAATRAAVLLQEGSAPADEASFYLGVALYAACTVVKHWRRWRRAGRPGHPFRRSTDWGDLPSGAAGVAEPASMHPAAHAAYMAQVVEMPTAAPADRRRGAEAGR